MLVFVDESGDTGRKFGVGSSELLTVILAILPEEDVANALDDRIVALREELSRDSTFEFHFKDCSDSIREAFFQAIVPFPFQYTGMVIDKAKWHSDRARQPSAFYRSVCGWVFEQAKPYLLEANVKIDKNGSERFCSELSNHLKRSTNEPGASVRHIKQVAMLESKNSNLMQLADMICGAVARSHRTDRPKPERFRKIIARREIAVRYWPE